MNNTKETVPIDLGGNYVLNPNYGGGAFRRRIRLSQNGDTVFGELEDSNHGFKVSILFDGETVKEINPEFPRIPFTTCSGAEQPLQALIGAAASSSPSYLNTLARPLENCTHLLDLTLLCISHRVGDDNTVVYDVEVKDQVAGVAELRIWRNDVLMHYWQAKDGAIISPEELNGRVLYKGFSAWANQQFTALENESAFVLHKANLVAIGRFLDVDALAGNRAIDENQRVACYPYSPPRSSVAIRLSNTVRDFSHTTEELLQFK